MDYENNSILCHSCNFWLEKVNYPEEERQRQVIVNGIHYRLGAENSTGPFRGFGGTDFTILFKDGRAVTSTNLWCQGEIPESFRDRLVDNATFLASQDDKPSCDGEIPF